jgi:hypothetical protein
MGPLLDVIPRFGLWLLEGWVLQLNIFGAPSVPSASSTTDQGIVVGEGLVRDFPPGGSLGLRIRCGLCGHRSRGHATIGFSVVCACAFRESCAGFVISDGIRFVLRGLSIRASRDIWARSCHTVLSLSGHCCELFYSRDPRPIRSRGSSRLVEVRGQDCERIRLSDVL